MTLDREHSDGAFTADPSHRLIAPRERQPRSAICSGFSRRVWLPTRCFWLSFFSRTFPSPPSPPAPKKFQWRSSPSSRPSRKPNQSQSSLPPPPDLVTPPVVKEKPPPEKVHLDDVEVAHDAPMAGNADQTRKAELEKETTAPRVAPPPKLAAPQPAQEKPEQEKAAAASDEKAANPSPPPESQKLADDTPDAEALDKAQPEPPAKPQRKQAPQDSKSPPAQGKKMTVAQQLAALSPAPNFSFGAAAKAAPISGGSEKASYEFIIDGIDKPPIASSAGTPCPAFNCRGTNRSFRR